MATNLEILQYIRLNNLDLKDYLIPHKESKTILKYSIKTYLKICKHNRVKINFINDNLIKDAYGGYMTDYRINCFKLLKGDLK